MANKAPLPTGWLSPLYRDRYQIVAETIFGEWEFTHYHLYKGEFVNAKTIRNDSPYRVEVYVVSSFPIDSYFESSLLDWFESEKNQLKPKGYRDSTMIQRGLMQLRKNEKFPSSADIQNEKIYRLFDGSASDRDIEEARVWAHGALA